MRPRDKATANEKRDELFAVAGWRCVVCGRQLGEGIPQLAHRIINSKSHIKEHGPSIIHHSFNLVPVCGLACNSRAILNGQPARDLLIKIQLNMGGMDDDIGLSEYYRELRLSFIAKEF